MANRLPVLNNDARSSALRSDGRREFVIPADVSGRFTRRRYFGFALLILIYAVTPWIKIGGNPAILMDIERRHFYLFGATFNAQDFWLAFFLLSGAGFALIVATAIWGRVWCGYACPQTVFLEGVYRRIERLIEGPRGMRLRRDSAPLSVNKAVRKVTKHALYVLVSMVVAHIFLSYFVPWPTLLRMVRSSPAAHPEAFAWSLAATVLMYFNFAWFREQLCLIVCPYGRMQSMLTDRDTLVIGYDQARGEPRGHAKTPGRGECVDCNRCVVVCPTGIDIRNGLQFECIGCAACADACDEVMDKIGQPRGLIRYDSLNGLEGKPKKFARPRVYVYAALGVLGLAVASFAFRARSSFEINLLRLPGAPFVLDRDAGEVRNGMELHVINKANEPLALEITPDEASGLKYVLPNREVTLPALSARRIPVFATAPDDGKPRSVKLLIRADGLERTVTGGFVAPR